jgi:hypothetical protein
MERAMRDYESLPGYDAWLTREPEYAEEPLPEDEEEEFEEPVIDEEWSPRGEYVTTVTFASGTKFVIRQDNADNWEVFGPTLWMDFRTREHALSWLTDIEHWGW